MTAQRINYYLDEFADEVVPCDCTLQGWADWLAKPDEDWNRDQAAEEGETFAASSIVVLGDVRVEWRDGKWEAVEPIPEGTDGFFLRHYQGGGGWDAEFAAGTITDATDCLEPEESPVWFACTKDGPAIRVQFNSTPAGPRLTVLGADQ